MIRREWNKKLMRVFGLAGLIKRSSILQGRTMGHLDLGARPGSATAIAAASPLLKQWQQQIWRQWWFVEKANVDGCISLQHTRSWRTGSVAAAVLLNRMTVTVCSDIAIHRKAGLLVSNIVLQTRPCCWLCREQEKKKKSFCVWVCGCVLFRNRREESQLVN